MYVKTEGKERKKGLSFLLERKKEREKSIANVYFWPLSDLSDVLQSFRTGLRAECIQKKINVN